MEGEDMQADSLPAEPPGKPKNSGMGSLSILQGIFLPRNWTGVSYIAGGFFTSWATMEAPDCHDPASNPAIAPYCQLYGLNSFAWL